MDYTTLLKTKSKDPLIEKYLKDPFYTKPNLKDALELSTSYNISLHPQFLYYWTEITPSEFIEFLQECKECEFQGKQLIFHLKKQKRTFEILGIQHQVHEKNPLEEEFEHTILLEEQEAQKLFVNLGLKDPFFVTKEQLTTQLTTLLNYTKEHLDSTVLEILNHHSKVELRDKAGSYIGARMGRPEKAKMRKQFNDETRSHGLFPVGEQGGRLKNIVEVLQKKGYIEEEFRVYTDPKTKQNYIYPKRHFLEKPNELQQSFFEKYTGKEIDLPYIERTIEELKSIMKVLESKENFEQENLELKDYYKKISNEKTLREEILVEGQHLAEKIVKKFGNVSENKELRQKIGPINNFIRAVYYSKRKIETKELEQELRDVLGSDTPYPKHVKGITNTINKHHSTEHISKGFLRQKHGVFVNKDGTVRFDMIEMGMTHTKPKEIGTSIEKLHELGYTHDYLGNPLENENQIIELMPQDVALPDCSDSGDELASDFVLKTGAYVDELLQKLYGLEPFYNFKTKEDTIGHMLIGLAPHTSAGIVGRIIGYTKTQGCFSHPVWHAAQRRNLDGDENGVMLLLDGLINFSREYLPDRRGSRTMDVSLVLTSHLYLDQIDDEVHGMDIVSYYPKEFYDAATEYKSPKEVKIEKVEERINLKDIDKRYLHYGFTHSTDNMNNTQLCSSYKSVPSMTEKLDLQLGLGKKIRAVDENKVGELVIDKHFMKDIKGNLRKFSMQQFRCTNCNTKYRRPPLIGKCTNCGEPSVNFTISEGSVKKYVSPSFKIIGDLNVDPYIAECVELVNLRIEGVFGREKEKQRGLNEFFGK